MERADRRREDRAWRDQLAEIVATLPAGVMVHNHDGMIAYANLEAARIFGHTQAQLVGRRHTDRRWKVTDLDGAPIDPENRVVSRVLETGQPVHNFESIIERQDGTRVIVSQDGAPFCDSSDHVIAVIVSFTDITERTKVEQEHEKMRTLLGAVIDHMPVGVIVAEAPSGRLIMGNEKLEEIWGRSLDTAEPLAEFRACRAVRRDGDPYDTDECPLGRALQKGETVVGEKICLRGKDGTLPGVTVSSAPIRDQQGRTIAAVAIFSKDQ